MIATYYADSFTSDLRWAILIIVCTLAALALGIVLVAAAAMWPAKSLEQRGMLPQDQSVRLTEMPYDWKEWEREQ